MSFDRALFQAGDSMSREKLRDVEAFATFNLQRGNAERALAASNLETGFISR